MPIAATTAILLYVLTMTTGKSLSDSERDATGAEIHQAVRAMMAGYFEGDIVLPETSSRSGINDPPQKWTGGVIPYEVQKTIEIQRNFIAVKRAMEALENRTCLRFVEHTDEPDFLHLISGQGCYSYVGRVGGRQYLSLGYGCLFMTIVAHELLHAVGFHHEQTRPDRDTYVNVLLENVIPGYEFNFEKRNWSSVTVKSPFDMASVMLYGSDSFAIDHAHPTILTKNDTRILDVYEKTEISDEDIERVNVYYEC